MSIPADIELDLSGLSCPMPLLKAKLALNAMEKEQILKIIATGSASERDFHMFARQSDNEILEFKIDNQAYLYWIRKG